MMEVMQMQELVRQLPEAMLENYTSNYEAGKVGGYMSCTNCVAASTLNHAGEEDMAVRWSGYASYTMRVDAGVPQPGEAALERLENGYARCKDEAGFRRQLYDVVVEEQAARRGQEIAASVEPEALALV